MYKYEYRRRSIRLGGYDYGQAGYYYVTICVQNKQWPFGRIENDQVIRSPAGGMVDKWWCKIPAKFSGLELGEYVIMPDHFHGIIHIVGAAPCGRPATNRQGGDTGKGAHMGAPLHKPRKPRLGDIIDWFKTMTTNEYIRKVDEYGWEPFYGRLWQRNYYEHIIRNEEEFSYQIGYILYPLFIHAKQVIIYNDFPSWITLDKLFYLRHNIFCGMKTRFFKIIFTGFFFFLISSINFAAASFPPKPKANPHAKARVPKKEIISVLISVVATPS